MFISQREGGQLITSQTLNLCPGIGEGVNCYMVSVTPVCAIFYGHTLSIKDGAYRSC